MTDRQVYWSARRIVFFHEVKADLTRQPVLLIWGALLLGIYFSGWWRGDLEKAGLAVLITFFVTAPHARGLMVGLGLAVLLLACMWTGNGIKTAIGVEIRKVERAFTPEVRRGQTEEKTKARR